MNCPVCGKENPDGARECQYCKGTLKYEIKVRVSRLAIVAIILVLFCLVLTVPAIVAIHYPRVLSSRTPWVIKMFSLRHILLIVSFIFGITSFVQIEKSGGLITGRKLSVVSILLPIFAGLFPVWYVIANYPRSRAFRMVCATNLSGIGKAMVLYGNEYDDEFPRAGGKASVWSNQMPDWKAQSRLTAFGIDSDGSGGQATISSSLYLLVRYAEVEPKRFICNNDPNTTEFLPRKYGMRDNESKNFWDFGPEPWKHCSYSYHMPYGEYALTSSSDSALAVAADRNPWILSSAGKAKDFKLFDPDGDINAVRVGNSPYHRNKTQNVLFMDIHVAMEKTSTCGANDDNIYTSWDGEDIRKGIPPKLGSKPADKMDSLLVNDPPINKP
jgi:predicted nucleic acid-binding Zn ribbon protein